MKPVCTIMKSSSDSTLDKCSCCSKGSRQKWKQGTDKIWKMRIKDFYTKNTKQTKRRFWLISVQLSQFSWFHRACWRRFECFSGHFFILHSWITVRIMLFELKREKTCLFRGVIVRALRAGVLPLTLWSPSVHNGRLEMWRRKMALNVCFDGFIKDWGSRGERSRRVNEVSRTGSCNYVGGGVMRVVWVKPTYQVQLSDGEWVFIKHGVCALASALSFCFSVQSASSKWFPAFPGLCKGCEG